MAGRGAPWGGGGFVHPSLAHVAKTYEQEELRKIKRPTGRRTYLGLAVKTRSVTPGRRVREAVRAGRGADLPDAGLLPATRPAVDPFILPSTDVLVSSKDGIAKAGKHDALTRICAQSQWDFRGSPLYKVLDDQRCCAILDNGPAGWADGTMLLFPKQEAAGLHELNPAVAGHLGEAISVLSAAVRAALSELLKIPIDSIGISVMCSSGRVAGSIFGRCCYTLVPRRPDDNRLKAPESAMLLGSFKGGYRALRDRISTSAELSGGGKTTADAAMQLAILRHMQPLRARAAPLQAAPIPGALRGGAAPVQIRIFKFDQAGKMIALDNFAGPEASPQSTCSSGPQLYRAYRPEEGTAIAQNQAWLLQPMGDGNYCLFNVRTQTALCAEGRGAFLEPGVAVRLGRPQHGKPPLKFKPMPSEDGYGIQFAVPLRSGLSRKMAPGGPRAAAMVMDTGGAGKAAEAADPVMRGASDFFNRTKYLMLTLTRQQPPRFNVRVGTPFILAPPDAGSVWLQSFRVAPFVETLHPSIIPGVRWDEDDMPPEDVGDVPTRVHPMSREGRSAHRAANVEASRAARLGRSSTLKQTGSAVAFTPVRKPPKSRW